MIGNGREGKGKTLGGAEKLENSGLTITMTGMEKIEYQGFQLSRYAAALAQREGIDVGLIKRRMDMNPRERLQDSMRAAAASKRMMEIGQRFRNER
jgi:hypothetical protein